MGTYVESKIITLTSQSATQKKNGSYLSSVYYDMGLFIKDEPDIIHRQIELQSAQIPYSFYVVNYTNNKIVIKKVIDVSFTTAYIPVGNYNGNSLINALVSLLTSIGIVPDISLSSINGVLTFLFQDDSIISNTSTCLEILGFDKNTTYTSVATILTAPYPLNLLGIKVLQIRSSVMNTTNFSSIHNGITTLLGTIPVSAVPFGMIDYTDKGNNRVTFTNSVIDELDIEILDGESGEFINFNNQDWTMTFVIYLTRLIEPPPPIPNYFNGLPIPLSLTNGSLALEKPIPNIIKPKPNKDLQELNLLTQ